MYLRIIHGSRKSIGFTTALILVIIPATGYAQCVGPGTSKPPIVPYASSGPGDQASLRAALDSATGAARTAIGQAAAVNSGAGPGVPAGKLASGAFGVATSMENAAAAARAAADQLQKASDGIKAWTQRTAIDLVRAKPPNPAAAQQLRERMQKITAALDKAWSDWLNNARGWDTAAAEWCKGAKTLQAEAGKKDPRPGTKAGGRGSPGAVKVVIPAIGIASIIAAASQAQKPPVPASP